MVPFNLADQVSLFLLVLMANGAPILIRGALGNRGRWPVDGGRILPLDGRPWLGPSKTWRGLMAAILGTGLLAPVLDMPFCVGASVGGLAMLGDLSSSFIKRRLGLASGDMALGLDQIPESLLPMFGIGPDLGLATVSEWVILFVVVELGLSRLLFAIHVREHPY